MADPKEETEWLLPTPAGQKGTFLGYEIVCDDESWQWCLTLPLVKDNKLLSDSRDMSIQMSADDVQKNWKLIFKEKALHGMAPKETEAMSHQDFHSKVRQKMMEIFSSTECGLKLKSMQSIDGDELFLLVELETSSETMKTISDRAELRMPMGEAAYKAAEHADGTTLAMPTDHYHAGEFLAGASLPLFMRYDKGLHDKFDKFREVDAMRVCAKRMRQYVSFEELLNVGICGQIFPIHRYNVTKHFWTSGWSNFYRFCSMPFDSEIDNVRNYFGEEPAFFFHFFAFLTRWILVPALVGFLCFFRRLPALGFSLNQERMIQIAFATFLVAWSALFTSKYKQRANLKITQWGMRNYDSVAQVRKEFKKEKQGTWKEAIQNASHWKLALLFMTETIIFVVWANMFRIGAKNAMATGAKEYYGMPPKTANTAGKLLITINIKVVNAVWALMSPLLSGWENHRTDQQLKDAVVKKLFVVKFIVYYYPFFYIAFIKKYNEGCLSIERGCVPELKENLAIFFATHVVTTIVMLCIPMFLSWWQIRSELKTAEKKGKAKDYTYIQAQSKCPAYDGDTNDFMELTLSFGFVIMFSVALPVMTFLFFCVNLIEIKLLAFRMTSVNQRSVPRGQEGIGAWYSIIKSVCFIGVAVNVGMAVFTMHPFIDQPRDVRLASFIGLEHLMLFLMFVVQSATPEKALAQGEADAYNEASMDELLGDKDSKVVVPKTDPVYVGMTAQ